MTEVADPGAPKRVELGAVRISHEGLEDVLVPQALYRQVNERSLLRALVDHAKLGQAEVDAWLKRMNINAEG